MTKHKSACLVDEEREKIISLLVLFFLFLGISLKIFEIDDFFYDSLIASRSRDLKTFFKDPLKRVSFDIIGEWAKE